MANGERHAALDPSGYRVPEAPPVRRYFDELLSGAAETGIVVLVAEVAGTVMGMTELVIRSEPPPDHQILIPRDGPRSGSTAGHVAVRAQLADRHHLRQQPPMRAP